MSKPVLEISYLNECFDVDFVNGTLTWKDRPSCHFKSKRYENAYNSQRKGKQAGSICISHGYRYVEINGCAYATHRIIFEMFHGYLPKFVDHIDGNRSNNKIDNLRECTLSQNQYNSKIPKNNKSGIKGVYFDKIHNTWKAKINVSDKCINIGSFKTKEEAGKARIDAANKYHGEFANHGLKQLTEVKS